MTTQDRIEKILLDELWLKNDISDIPKTAKILTKLVNEEIKKAKKRTRKELLNELDISDI